MTITYRPARRENVALIVGVAGPTGSGKTYSALELAKGLAGPEGKVAVIDTEAGRALHYAPRDPGSTKPGEFEFMHFDLAAPFSPDAYREKIAEVDAAGIFDVIVVDSMSHEHAGEGGILDMHEAELDRMAGSDFRKRERVKLAAWAKPKGLHRKMVSRLLQCRAHLVLCFRAEEKALVGKDENGRQKIVAAADRPLEERWEPTAAKGLMYELTLSLLVLPDRPGVPHPVKLQEQHRHLVSLDRPLSAETGAELAAWAAGGAAPSDADPELLAAGEEWAAQGPGPLNTWWKGLTKDQKAQLQGDIERLMGVAKRAEAA